MFLLIAGGFAIAGIAVLTLMLSAMRELDAERDSSHLIKLASAMSVAVPAEIHSRLRRPSDTESKEAHDLRQSLERLISANPDIRSISTIRKVGDQYAYALLLDPQSRESVHTKINDPYGKSPKELVLAFQHAMPTVTGTWSDARGRARTCFVPIFDKEGRVESMMAVVETDARQSANGRSIAILGAATGTMVLVMSVLVAAALTQQLVRVQMRHRALAPRRASGSFLRSTLFEAALYLLVVSVVASGVLAYSGSIRDLAKWRQSTDAQMALLGLDRSIDARADDRASEIATMASRLGPFGLHDLKHEVRDLIPSIVKGDSAGRQAQDQIRRSIRTAASKIKSGELELNRRFLDRNGWVFGYTCVTAFMILAAMVSIRSANRHQQALSEAFRENDQLSELHRQLVEQLPIGLFTYSASGYQFHNASWSELTGATGEEDAWSALEAALHPDDREEVLNLLSESGQTASPFSCEFRLQTPKGELRYVKCRGIPVFDSAGQLEHMLAFAVDLTNTVEARSELEDTNRMLHRAFANLESNFEATVRALVKAVDAKDPYTAGHSERVMEYSMMIGRAMNLDDDQLHILQMGTLVHDIGKIGVPDAILTKPGRLTDAEYETIKSHAKVGFTLVQGIPAFRDCAGIVRWHHERLDGSGYPDGLSGSEIGLLVRIAAVADVWDAMTSTRAYRVGMSAELAIQELRREVEKGALDAKVVEVFADLMECRVHADQSLDQAA